MVDLSKHIITKSDQLNADDLLGGSKIITITAVKEVSGDQPIAISYSGDNGKPYKPCLSMRKVLVSIWGKDGAQYVGRKLELYCEKSVKFGGIEVGGIRIAAASHIEKDHIVPVTVTRGKKSPYKVKVLSKDGVNIKAEMTALFKSLQASIQENLSLDGLDADLEKIRTFNQKWYDALIALIPQDQPETTDQEEIM